MSNNDNYKKLNKVNNFNNDNNQNFKKLNKVNEFNKLPKKDVPQELPKKITIELPKEEIKLEKPSIVNEIKDKVKQDEIKDIKTNEEKSEKIEDIIILEPIKEDKEESVKKVEEEPTKESIKPLELKKESIKEPEVKTFNKIKENKKENKIIYDVEADILIDSMPEYKHGLTDDEISKMSFDDILRVILKDSDVTDVQFNGRVLYVQHNRKGRYKFSEKIDEHIIEDFVKTIANTLNDFFNVEHPILDCEIVDRYSPSKRAVLRLNAVHGSISPYGVTAAIRITQAELRLTDEDSTFASPEIFKLIQTMIRGNLNILISGRTGSGKTELQKFLVSYIRDAETIVLIEDTKDTNLKDLYPNKNISSWITNQGQSVDINFDTLIRASLRNNPDWIIISETRGSEAYSMIKSGLSGHKIITTLHSDSAESNVDRLVHMCKEKYDLDQKLLGKMITNVFDVGIHIDYDITKEGTKRYICEIVEYRDYSDRGVIINPIYSLKLQPVKQSDGTYSYQRVGEFGKLSKELFDKLAKKKVLSKDIDRFIEEGYYGEEKENK